MPNEGDGPAAMPAVAVTCEAITGANPCQHPAGYAVSLEEDGSNGALVLAARHVCAGHLAATADWALTRPTPYVGEAEDVYFTLYEQRVTVASLEPMPRGDCILSRTV